MFTTDLYALLSEVLVGSAAVATIFLIHWVLTCKSNARFIDFFRSEINSFLDRKSMPGWPAAASRENLLYPVIGSVVLGLGLAVQSTLDDFMDPHPVAPRDLGRAATIVFPTKAGIRFSAFFRAASQTGIYPLGYPLPCDETGIIKYKLTSLGQEILLNGRELISPAIPISLDPKTKENWRQFVLSPEDILNDAAARKAQCDIAKAVAFGIYYDSNNWAHRNDTIVAALRRWQIQIDTLGAVSMLSFAITAVTALYLLGVGFRHVVLQLPTLPDKRRSATWWLTASLIVAVFCLYGFVIGSKGYTGRIIGMYSSAHHNDDVKLSVVGCHRLVTLIPEIHQEDISADEPKNLSPWCTKALLWEKKQLKEKAAESQIDKSNGN